MKNKQWLLWALLINNRVFESGANHAIAIVYRQLGTPCQRWNGVTDQLKDERGAWHQQCLGWGGVERCLVGPGVGPGQGCNLSYPSITPCCLLQPELFTHLLQICWTIAALLLLHTTSVLPAVSAVMLMQNSLLGYCGSAESQVSI